LITEFKEIYEHLSHKRVHHGFWETISESRGLIPESRMGATLTKVGSKLVLFGGMSRHTFSDVKVFNLDCRMWTPVDPQRY
jgi:hypothetical protein